MGLLTTHDLTPLDVSTLLDELETCVTASVLTVLARWALQLEVFVEELLSDLIRRVLGRFAELHDSFEVLGPEVLLRLLINFQLMMLAKRDNVPVFISDAALSIHEDLRRGGGLVFHRLLRCLQRLERWSRGSHRRSLHHFFKRLI